MPSPNQNDLRALVTRPRPAFKRELGRTLRMRGGELGMAPARSGWMVPWGLRAGMAMAAFLLVAGGVFAYSSPSVTRSSPLYAVKRVGEGILLSLAHEPAQQVSLHFHLASRRVAEAQVIARTGDIDLETIAEAHANAEAAVAIASAFPSTTFGDIEGEKRAHTTALRTVSITAQVSNKRPMIVVDRDAFAMAPSRARVLPSPTPKPQVDWEFPASSPRRGAVADSTPVVQTNTTPPPAEVRLTANDPNVRALNAMIRASEERETPSSSLETGSWGSTAAPADQGANR